MDICILEYKLVTYHRCARKYRESCKATARELTFVKREYRETNCFFIRSNILIDSIRFWMNYSFREEWRNPLLIYIYICFVRILFRYIVFKIDIGSIGRLIAFRLFFSIYSQNEVSILNLS